VQITARRIGHLFVRGFLRVQDLDDLSRNYREDSKGNVLARAEEARTIDA
jgi:hypothetical protein